MEQTLNLLRGLLRHQSVTGELSKGVGSALEEESLVSTSAGPIPVKDVRDIYSTRAEMNKKKQEPIVGFEELMPNLYGTDIESVMIHSVKTSSRHYLVFTDSSLSLALGILLIK